MVVKDKIGRKRYIVAYINKNKVDAEKDLKNLAERNNVKMQKIIYYNGFLIIRADHRSKDQVLKILKYNNFKTYKTTGSVKKAKEIMNREIYKIKKN